MDAGILDSLFKALLGALVAIAFRVLTGPLLESVTAARLVGLLSWIPQPGREFQNLWQVTWESESEQYPERNRDFVRIHQLWKFVTFKADFPSSNGSRKYEFFGRWEGNTLSGRWYDTGSPRGYHGTFHVVLQGDRYSAVGQWLGYSSEGKVRNGEFVMAQWRPSVS